MTFKFDIINIQKKELSTLQFSQHYQKKLGSYIYGNGKWWLCLANASGAGSMAS